MAERPSDPLEALRVGAPPDRPDPTFVTHLRTRLARALELPRGVTVSTTHFEDLASSASDRPASERAPVTSSLPEASVGLTPYLAVDGAARAIDWYVDVLGARLDSPPVVMPDGSIGHVELALAGGRLMLSEQHPEIGVVAPETQGGVPVTLHLDVADVDAVMARCVRAGARLERPAADYDYGRNGVLRDPFGHRWLIASEPASEPAGAGSGAEPRVGDLAYGSLFVPDVERAADFFATVLGWRYAPGSAPQGRQVVGQSLPQGLWGGPGRPGLHLAFTVADLATALNEVTDAGGTAGPVREESYGLVADCLDDQGNDFSLHQPPGGPGRQAAPANGRRQGDLAYVTVLVADSGRARAFYGRVLGWRFASGQADDGWQVEDTVPMTGLAGGREPVTVPMYRVDDIDSAVERVRRAGGEATAPNRQPYGITAECRDDQGTAFYLGQL